MVLELEEKSANSDHFIKWFILSILVNLLVTVVALYIAEFIGRTTTIDYFIWFAPPLVVGVYIYSKNSSAAFFGWGMNTAWNVFYLLGLVCVLFRDCL